MLANIISGTPLLLLTCAIHIQGYDAIASIFTRAAPRAPG
jgi:hypothetical protein